MYFYRSDNLLNSGNSEQLANSFLDDVLPAIQALQVADVLHTNIIVRNLFDPGDNFNLAISEPGDISTVSQNLPNFVALPFRLLQANGAVKNGSKRVAGMREEIQDDGVVTNAGFLTDAADAADAMLASLGNGAFIDVWYPVIVKRLLEGGNYSLPTSADEAIFGVLVDVIFDVLLTSQTSRKLGVGS